MEIGLVGLDVCDNGLYLCRGLFGNPNWRTFPISGIVWQFLKAFILWFEALLHWMFARDGFFCFQIPHQKWLRKDRLGLGLKSTIKNQLDEFSDKWDDLNQQLQMPSLQPHHSLKLRILPQSLYQHACQECINLKTNQSRAAEVFSLRALQFAQSSGILHGHGQLVAPTLFRLQLCYSYSAVCHRWKMR